MTESRPLASNSARVRVCGLYAGDALGAGGGSLGRVWGIDWTLGHGIHAVIGTPEDGTAALAGVLTGELRPKRGSVYIEGVAPFASAVCRRRIGALLPRSTGLGGTVRELIALSHAVRGGDVPLDRLGLGALRARRNQTLSVPEARALELALALATPTPSLVVLHEPWNGVAGVDPIGFRELLLERAASAPVVVLTSVLTEVAKLADSVHLLEGGRWAAVDGGSGWLARAAEKLLVWLEDPNGLVTPELAATLSTRVENARSVSWERIAGPPQLGLVAIAADDLEAAALTVSKVCAELAVNVRALATTPLERAALLGLVRAAASERSP